MPDEFPIRIDLERITSSNLAAIGYERDKQILAVQFKSGDIWHYAGVPNEVADAFYCAPSRGSYYAHHIRSKYEGEKMTGPCPACGARGWIGDPCDCEAGIFAREERRRNGKTF